MTNPLFPNRFKISRAERTGINTHLPAVLWFTGLSGSGKSTIANQVEYELNKTFQAHTYLLDGDTIRSGLNSDLGFSAADRKENIRRIGEVARLFYDAGLIVLVAFISPYREDRDSVRKLLPEKSFIEIFVRCPLQVCEERDTKGLYRKARAGEIVDFTGISSPYEPPAHPEIELDTSVLSVTECTQRIVQVLQQQGTLQPSNS